MILRKKSHHLVLWSSLALATLASCNEGSPTETVSIFVGGQCFIAANTIVCQDASRSEPTNRLTVVDWELTSSLTGLPLGVLPSAPGGQISFTGLATGNYQVNQLVSARDGSVQERSYGPLSVEGTTFTIGEPLKSNSRIRSPYRLPGRALGQ